MTTLLQDVRYGLRMLVKKPTFTIVVGANTAILSIVNERMKSRLAASIRCSFLYMNLGGRILGRQLQGWHLSQGPSLSVIEESMPPGVRGASLPQKRPTVFLHFVRPCRDGNRW